MRLQRRPQIAVEPRHAKHIRRQAHLRPHGPAEPREPGRIDARRARDADFRQLAAPQHAKVIAAPRIFADAAGNVWVLEFRGNKIAKFSDGKFTEFAVPGEWSGLSGVAVDADGSVWFGMVRGHAIGRLRDGQFKIFELPRKDARPYTVAVDRSGNVWYADISGFVGMLKASAAKR